MTLSTPTRSDARTARGWRLLLSPLDTTEPPALRVRGLAAFNAAWLARRDSRYTNTGRKEESVPRPDPRS